MKKADIAVQKELVELCQHCGDVCEVKVVNDRDETFCCHGCKMVFQLLIDNNLGDYYHIDESSKIGLRPTEIASYDYLDDQEIIAKLLHFQSEEACKVSFELPSIHCSSCIWLLENLAVLSPGVKQVKVDFLKKTCSILYNPQLSTLKDIVVLLSKIGYAPRLQLSSLSATSHEQPDRTIYYKLGVAGFAFGNIMLLSFPEYLGMHGDTGYALLGYLSITLSLPVLCYAGIDFLKSAWYSIKLKKLGIDIPIAIGMLVLFVRSVVEIISQTGEGYLDSFAGFVFFLLIGRWFQQYALAAISFDRDYRSFLPIAIMKKMGDLWEYVNIQKIEIGDLIRIKNNEIIPCDGVLVAGLANIDYSFVTGESVTESPEIQGKVQAGGKQVGGAIDILVSRSLDQSYLTRLWAEEAFQDNREIGYSRIVDRIGSYFVLIVLLIAALSLIYWIPIDTSTAIKVFSSVLIIACPCVLALAVPFLYGNAMRILARRQVYVRNTAVLERIADIDHIVFDKTGTITNPDNLTIHYKGKELSEDEQRGVANTVRQSTHPLSKAIASFFKMTREAELSYFKEEVGQGLCSVLDTTEIRIGSPAYILETDSFPSADTAVLVEINKEYKGYFIVRHELRDKVGELFNSLREYYSISLLSGDNDRDVARMRKLFGDESNLYFNQQPLEKLKYIQRLKEECNGVMMIGDGLNDAGALKQSDVGIVLAQHHNSFTPASDMIIHGDSFSSLARYLYFIKKIRVLLYGAFVFAFIYNTIGLYFAVNGWLSPVVAAILMPISSLTVMFYGMVTTALWARRVLH